MSGVRRREFIVLLGTTGIALPLQVGALQAEKIYRIGFLANDPTIPAQAAGQAFLDGLRESGLIEGRNVLIEWRFAEARPDRYPELVAELIRMPVDIIVTSATLATLAAKRANAKVPIVMLSVSDPVGEGIVASLAHPGGTITGLSQDDSPEIAAKRLQFLKEAVPSAVKVGVLINPDLQNQQAQWQQSQRSAPSLNVTLYQLVVRQRSEIESAFASIGRDRPDAILLSPSELTFVNRRLIAELATKTRLPTIGFNREYAEAGGLASYGYVRPDSFRRAAIYAAKVLEGAKPADLPVEVPTKFELIINLKTAKALGLTVSPTLLGLADEVIE